MAKSDHLCARPAIARLAIILGVPFLLLTIGACQSLRVGEEPAASASMGLLIAQDNCARCHQIGGAGDSPDEDAPEFGEIADRPGMTAATLATWLSDAHNYPIEMGFRLEPHEIDSLALYIMRWRSSEQPPSS